MSNLLYGLLALVALGVGGWFLFGGYKGAEGSTLPLVIGIISIIVGIVFGGLFLAGRVNKTEDIHITE